MERDTEEYLTGLSPRAVEEMKAQGKVNEIPSETSQTAGTIVKKNLFTFFNIVLVVLGVLEIIAVVTGHAKWTGPSFLLLVVFNSGLGIFQQLRAKKVLDNLNLISQSRVNAIRNGSAQSVPVNELVLGDIIELGEGQQIPADAVVVGGKVNVNESLLTGESDEIEKLNGAELKSGSFVVNGKCYAQLTQVGADSYAAKLTAKAKEVKEKQSEMVRGIDIIIKFAGVVIIPIGVMLVVSSMLNGKGFLETIDPMVAAVTGVIPQGLALLVTVALALGSMRLAQKSVLLHDMKSIETLARVDVLCVDKTGTITTNEMEVTEVFGASTLNDSETEKYTALLSKYINTITDSNITMEAMREYFGKTEGLNYINMLPFTSKNKYSQIETSSGTFRLGAPEILLDGETLEAVRGIIEQRTAKGFRVLAFVEVSNGIVIPTVFVSIKNTIRKNAVETFGYFKKQEVKIKVISGDNPMTVSKVATQAGIEDADKFVDTSSIHSKEELEKAAVEYTVFGRVKPEQKKIIVTALKNSGLKVAMTGDGVNDILAMKEADCSIAMGSGSDAARQAAQVVLLDDDFSKMKSIVSEGRQIINNITRSATLFLYKNLFSVFLAIFSIVLGLAYPLTPQNVGLVSMFNIGVPAFLLALEKNHKKQHGRFLKTTLVTALPASITSFAAIGALVLFYNRFNLNKFDLGAVSTYLLALVGFMILYNLCREFNTYRFLVFVICIVGFVAFVMIKPLRSFYNMPYLALDGVMLAIVFAFAEESVFRIVTGIFEQVPLLPEKIKNRIKKEEE